MINKIDLIIGAAKRLEEKLKSIAIVMIDLDGDVLVEYFAYSGMSYIISPNEDTLTHLINTNDIEGAENIIYRELILKLKQKIMKDFGID